MRRGCAVGAIVLAHETLPADAHSMDWMGKAEAILHESFDFIEGITCGFDGGNPGDGEESEFNRGVGYGRAVAQAMHLCTGPEAAAVISSAAELPAINQMTESETPLAIPF